MFCSADRQLRARLRKRLASRSMQPAGRAHRRRRWWAAVVPAAVVFAACVPPKQPPPPPASPLFQAACDGVLQGSVAGQVESERAHGDLGRRGPPCQRRRPLGAQRLRGHGRRLCHDHVRAAPGLVPAHGPRPPSTGRTWRSDPARRTARVTCTLPTLATTTTPAGRSVVLPRAGTDDRRSAPTGRRAGAHERHGADAAEYPDGPHDAEALAVDPANGDLVIVTKEDLWASKGRSTCARRPQGGYVDPRPEGPDPPRSRHARHRRRCISRRHRGWTLRTYTSLSSCSLARPRRPSTRRSDPVGCTGTSAPENQGEAIAVNPDGRGYVTISEGAQPPINRFSVRERPQAHPISVRWLSSPTPMHRLPKAHAVVAGDEGGYGDDGRPATDLLAIRFWR